MSRAFRLPEPRTPRRRKPTRCEACRQPLRVTRGWGSCEACGTGTALPIGHVITKGHKGKEVYLASSILRELAQEGSLETAREDLQDELKDRAYLVIEEVEPD